LDCPQLEGRVKSETCFERGGRKELGTSLEREIIPISAKGFLKLPPTHGSQDSRSFGDSIDGIKQTGGLYEKVLRDRPEK